MQVQDALRAAALGPLAWWLYKTYTTGQFLRIKTVFHIQDTFHAYKTVFSSYKSSKINLVGGGGVL